MSKSKLELFTDKADKLDGFDLRIDESVQRKCDVYNATSNATRTVIYVLMIVNIIALIAVLNTNRWNWTNNRLLKADSALTTDEYNHAQNLRNFQKHQNSSTVPLFIKGKTSLNSKGQSRLHIPITSGTNDLFEKKLELQQLKTKDSVQLEIDMEEKRSLIRNHIENSRHISIPLLGNSFDINDLSQVSGVCFLILLVMLRFTIAREKDNLKIAFNAITQRYTDDKIDVYLLKAKPVNMDKQEFINLVNFKRRRYHYNSVSMSEIFNLPKLDITKNILPKTLAGKYVKNHLFFFSWVTYFLIVLNDILTVKNGFVLSIDHTTLYLSFSIFWAVCIAYVCHSCNYQKATINMWFDRFYDNYYIGKRSEYLRFQGKRWKWYDYILYFPAALFIALPQNIIRYAKKLKKRKLLRNRHVSQRKNI